jgi:hypothetical protein
MGKHSRDDEPTLIGEVRQGSSINGLTDRVSPTGDVQWDGYSHAQLWDMIMRSKPDVLFTRVAQWHTAAERLADRNKFLQERLNALLATWQGPAAEAAAISQQQLLAWAQDAATRASTVGTHLGDYGNALVSARQRMPQPQHRGAELNFRDGDGAQVRDGVPGAHMLLQLTSDRLPTAQEAREAKREAVRIMRELEDNAVEAEQGMPRFTPPPPATNPAPFEPAPRQPAGDDWSPSPVQPPAHPRKPPFDATPYSTTTAQTVGYGTSEPPGVLPHGGGTPGGQPGLLGRAPVTGGGLLGVGGEVGALGRGLGVGTGPLGGAGQSLSAPSARPTATGLGNALLPGPTGTRTDGDEDRDKPLADFLEPDDIFGDDRPASPPVLGAVT